MYKSKIFFPNFPLFTFMLSSFGVGLGLMLFSLSAENTFDFMLFIIAGVPMIIYPIFGIMSNSFIYNRVKHSLLITNQYKIGYIPTFLNLSLDNISQIYFGKLKKFSNTHPKEFNKLMEIHKKNFQKSKYGYLGGRTHDNIMNVYMDFFNESIAFIKTKDSNLVLLKVDAIDNSNLYKFYNFLTDYGIQNITFDMKKKDSRSMIIKSACFILLCLVYVPLVINIAKIGI